MTFQLSEGRTKGRWIFFQSEYVWYAAWGDSRVEVSDTGTSHHDSLSGAKISGSVSTWITVVRSLALATLTASVNSAAVPTRITSAPRLAALAARSTGSVSPSRRPSPLRYRYAVPNR